MFTGIIEEMGAIISLERGTASGRLTVQASQVLGDVKLGDSIAVNGVCLTVAAFGQERFSADVMAETLNKTTLGSLKTGERINLERAVRPVDRLGGHLVQGHVDGTGLIKEDRMIDIARVIRISAPPELLRYVVPKGSIAIDGISLTVVEVFADSFSVSLIPHTAALTTLGFKKTGDRVNLESDIIGRYVEKLLGPVKSPAGESRSRLDSAFLAENGFI